jgi:putative oxidoreductase
MKNFPFASLPQLLVVLRVGIALVFLAHAIVRIANGSIDQFGGFLNAKGLFLGKPLVILITVYEIAGGILLALGYMIRWLSAGFIFILVMGIVLIHVSFGWFVGEHGTGGMEYSFVLIMALLVIAAGSEK